VLFHSHPRRTPWKCGIPVKAPSNLLANQTDNDQFGKKEGDVSATSTTMFTRRQHDAGTTVIIVSRPLRHSWNTSIVLLLRSWYLINAIATLRSIVIWNKPTISDYFYSHGSSLPNTRLFSSDLNCTTFWLPQKLNKSTPPPTSMSQCCYFSNYFLHQKWKYVAPHFDVFFFWNYWGFDLFLGCNDLRSANS
jgi:hypothetical protein